MNTHTNFGTLLMKALNERKMSQQEFADEMETTQSTVWQWMNGKSEPTLIKALRACKMLGINPNEITI